MTVYLVLLWMMMAYLILVEPFVGHRMYQRLASGMMTRLRFYRITIAWEWASVVICVLLFLLGRIPLRLLGLYNPRGFFFPPGMLGGILIGICIGLVAVTLIGVIVGKRGNRGKRDPLDSTHPGKASAHEQDGQKQLQPVRIGRIDALLPRTKQERLTFALVAVTAGICEEILFRGLPVYLLDKQFPNLGPILVVVLVGLVFGFAHFYQGPAGIVATGFLGAVFAGVYLATGALYIPIIIHALIDLRAALFPGNSVPTAPDNR